MTHSQQPTPKKVEIKLTVAGAAADPAAVAFGLQPDQAGSRQIWFVESRAGLKRGRLALLKRGIILRLRKIEGASDDSTLKLRGKTIPEFTAEWRDLFSIEGDWSATDRVLSASLVAELATGNLDRAVAADGDLHQGFDADQLKYLAQECTPALDVATLVALGPVQALKWPAFTVPGFAFKLRAERWQVGDLLFLEFSIQVNFADATAAQVALAKVLIDRQVLVSGHQAAKTTLVLQHLAGIAGA